MNNTQLFDSFTNKYSLSKTLRFELIPQEKTKEHIEQKGLLTQDEKRAEDYQQVKKIIDRYHKQFIETALEGLQLKDLQKYQELYSNRDKSDAEKKEFEKLKDTLRKQIADRFSEAEGWKNLFAKELIKEDLLRFTDETNEVHLINEFKDFTTYFTGFHENRKNMYSSESIATSIAYRIVHENLPKFLDNLRIFEKVKEQKDFDFASLEKNLEAVLQGETIKKFFTLKNFNNCLTQHGIDKYNTVLGGIAEEGQKKIQGLNEWINLYRQQKQIAPKDLP
ncbi:MAG: type V CRISPR-associated protein Cpf1, partial [Bacteroidota bacterium]